MMKISIKKAMCQKCKAEFKINYLKYILRLGVRCPNCKTAIWSPVVLFLYLCLLIFFLIFTFLIVNQQGYRGHTIIVDKQKDHHQAKSFNFVFSTRHYLPDKTTTIQCGFGNGFSLKLCRLIIQCLLKQGRCLPPMKHPPAHISFWCQK